MTVVKKSPKKGNKTIALADAFKGNAAIDFSNEVEQAVNLQKNQFSF